MILLLAGTSDARRLAGLLAARGLPAMASLAGATREPAPLPLPTRHGPFGGDDGFRAFLDAHPVSAVIDATHPFAARVTARTQAVCAARALPLLRLERPGWGEGPGRVLARDEADAARLIPPEAVVFLATGRQSLPAWGALRAARVHLRVIDPPLGPFPHPGGFVEARPPFDRDAEAALFRALGVTHLVAKDAGGTENRAKLDAARDLGIATILLARPPRPEGLRVVGTPEAAMAWAAGLPDRSTVATPPA